VPVFETIWPNHLASSTSWAFTSVRRATATFRDSLPSSAWVRVGSLGIVEMGLVGDAIGRVGAAGTRKIGG